MAFRFDSEDSSFSADPEALFRDLRSRTVEGLLAQQADTLRSYMSKENEPDIALELPTGSGKTLVGLLIAEWQRRRYGRRCVLLCPTKQLVQQVVEQAAEKYGIAVLNMSGSKKEFAPKDVSSFESSEAIAVTTYSNLFNYKSYFDNVSTFIFDDAHSAENYVSNCWSLEIRRSKHGSVFSAMRQFLAPFIPEHENARFDADEDSPLDAQWVNKIPLPKLVPAIGDLVRMLDAHCKDVDELLYPWLLLRDHVEACNIFYTSSQILIRPIVPPTSSHAPFTRASQRIYMSATLGEGGDLERIFGREKICRIPAPPGWEKQGIGRRFFVFPMRVVPEEEAQAAALNWITKFTRCLVLTPRNTEVEAFQELIEHNRRLAGYEIVSKYAIENSKKAFTEKEKSIAILANRYDGIDLIGNECRYEIVSGLPESTNLQERFLVSRMAASKLFDVRLRTRITQAVGRCTRSATDWALVVVIGEKIQKYLSFPEHRCYFHPELQAEVDFGLTQSKVDDLAELGTQIDLFVAQGTEWKAADTHILKTRDRLSQKQDPQLDALSASVGGEVRYLNCLWNSQYAGAVSAAKDVLASLHGDILKGYRAWWYYLAGNAAHLAARAGDATFAELAREHYSAAAATAQTLPWLSQLRISSKDADALPPEDVDFGKMVEGIEVQMEKFGIANSAKLERTFASIRNGLRSIESSSFESAQVVLGELMGFHAGNSSDDGAPDPWWVLGATDGIVFEDYTETGAKPQLSKAKILQGKGHKDWLKQDYNEVDFRVIFCARNPTLSGRAERFLEGAYYVSVEEFLEFSERCLSLIRDLWDRFPGAADLVWRTEARDTIAHRRMKPADILAAFMSTPLKRAFDK